MERKIAWVPCAGLNFTDPPRPRNHIGEIRLKNSKGEFVPSDEWVTELQAKKKYPGIIISGSHTRCPDCSEIWMAAAQAYIESKKT